MNIERRKIFSENELLIKLSEHRRAGHTISFTNGCFDVLHIGHIRLLQTARKEGDLLVVAINSDVSVRTLDKGDDRPIHPQDERAEVLAAFAAVDYVTIFEESSVLPLIERLRPDVLVKGGDWGKNQVVGREVVEGYGGRVLQTPMVHGKSTTGLVEKVRREDPTE